MKNLFKFSVILLIIFTACDKDIPYDLQDDLYNYVEPDYPQNLEGRYLSYIYIEAPDIPNPPFQSGKKVEFVYDNKNYVDHILIYGDNDEEQGREINIDYNVDGSVKRIKYYNNENAVITSYEQFEYDVLGRLFKFERFDKQDNSDLFDKKTMDIFYYPSNDTIIQMRYGEFYNFEDPFKDVYIKDENGNVREKVNYSNDENSIYPTSSTDYIYDDKKRIFENLDLPYYRINYDSFQLYEIFSNNNWIGSQAYSYDYDGTKIPFGELQTMNFEYDELGFPVSRNELIFYYYVDLD